MCLVAQLFLAESFLNYVKHLSNTGKINLDIPISFRFVSYVFAMLCFDFLFYYAYIQKYESLFRYAKVISGFVVAIAIAAFIKNKVIPYVKQRRTVKV